MYRFFPYLILVLVCCHSTPCANGQITGYSTASGVPASQGPPMDCGNSWYKVTQNYIKFQVWEDGWYKVTLQDLVNANVNVSGLDPDKVQLIYRGEEIPVRVLKNGSHLDYLEFWGMKNDGRVDSLMYRDPNNHLPSPDLQPNIFRSLFSDTSAYFMTWDDVGTQRYEETSSGTYAGLTPEPWFRTRVLREQVVRYFTGGGSADNPFNVLNCDYIIGEGYVSHLDFGGAAVNTYTLTTPAWINSGRSSTIDAKIIGTTSHNHLIQINVNNNPAYNDNLVDINIKTHTFNYNNSLTASTTLKFYGNGSMPDKPDKNTVAWMQVSYDRTFNLANLSSIEVSEWQRPDTARFRFTNVSVANEAWLVDPIHGQLIQGVVNGTTVDFVVPGAPHMRKFYLVADQAFKSPQILPYTSLNNLSNVDAGTEFVIIAHPSLRSSAENYRLYRDTCSVNPLRGKVVYTDEIFDEFGYGTFTPWAIKRFCAWALHKWKTPPKYILLWGKGTYKYRATHFNLVPVFGYPANDYEYVSYFDPKKVNLIPEGTSIGRINVFNDAEGEIYRKKVDEYEHTPYSEWMKEFVMLGGGKTSGEQNGIFSSLVGEYAPSLESPPVGGNVQYWQNRNASTQTNSVRTSESVISSGVGLIHFFGHSASNIFDVDILQPSQYNNFGKYPFMIAFGCYGGDFTNSGKSFGESFVLEPGRGAIGYLANSTAGYISNLKNFGLDFYDNATGDYYGYPIGDIIRETLRDFVMDGNNHTTNIYAVNHARQLNLQMDPSIRLRLPVKPDLMVREGDAFFSDPDFSAQDLQFTLELMVRNQGKATPDSFLVQIRQKTPSGETVDYPSQKFGPVRYRDTLRITLPNNLGPAMAGLNEFTFFVDAADSLDEYYETNNSITLRRIIPGNVPALLFPCEFEVVGQKRIKLSASTFVMRPRAELHYIFQIDTAHTFDSPFLKESGPVDGSANLCEWELPFDLKEGKVYYWRVRLAHAYPIAWASSSFKFLEGKQGWAQSRPPQFFEDVTTQIHLDQLAMEWEFENRIEMVNSYIPDYGNFSGKPEYFLNTWGSSNNTISDTGGVMYTPIDGKTLVPAIQGTINGDWAYLPAPGALNNLVSTISSMEIGDYILICSQKNPRVHLWNDNTLRALEQIGCEFNQMRALQNGDHFIILGRKGDQPGRAKVIDKPNLDLGPQGKQYSLLTQLSAPNPSGTITSPIIGPVLSWDEFSFDWSSLEPLPHEKVRLSLFGVTPSNVEVLLTDNLGEGSFSIDTLSNQTYPYLRFSAKSTDSTFFTAPQLNNWQVFFEPTPEAFIDPSPYSVLPGDTLVEGQVVEFKVAARNISPRDMDSLLVRLSLERGNRQNVVLETRRMAPLAAFDSLEISYTLTTGMKGLAGASAFIIEINPDLDQPEKYHFNNIYRHTFYVQTDETPPILDVTFDGKRLIDGDIVSPEPEIVVQLNDDNRYIPVTISDSTFKLWFGPGRALNLLSPVALRGNPQIETHVVSMPANKSRLTFRPGRLEDGEYTLRIQGFDPTGNPAGPEEYVVRINVVNEKSMSHVLNYPNPFSTSTQFVYTLTGDEKPFVFEIHIYSISGKLVKVIDMIAEGGVNFGYNISEYAWDGRDDFGDLLANGVYVYKVITKFTDRRNVKLRDEGISDHFSKNGYGKIYILR